MDDWQVDPIALHIVTPPGRARPARVQALMEYLAGHFTSEPWARSIGGQGTPHSQQARLRRA